MPHQCTECGYTFPDGSKEMLSGCPDCGGNKFQYHPDATPDEPDDAESPPERPDAGVSGAVGRAANTVRDVFGDDDERSAPRDAAPAPDSSNDDPAETESRSGRDADPDDAAPSPAREDRAQADARSEVVDAEDLPDPASSADGDADAAVSDAPTPDPEEIDSTEQEPPDSGGASESPELSELREELNSQFESIRIVEPGQYELNLMELYDREQYIIALQEDGRYVIDVPDSWRDDA